ncbi:GNAT family N-acetyltransferase [Aeromicrobium choanae]|uniref:[SSU ribosomal protein S5P]-alanine acetyltransferase n=1 Tax=Aeromicrobium choanae TaxID=1736691 RepID=A0A1T4Z114_9ACTN|nr:GNAT family N-acetyltransferase [Aeromicrobium choanae]SKB07583.1 [SSU ribosomal protein S5P]-alanine acetyltransferase [Aeromicrobium choanae]
MTPPPGDGCLRLVTPDDADELAEVWSRNRAFLAPWEPWRDDAFFTPGSQRSGIERDLAEHAAGRMVPFVICGPDGDMAGRLTLSGVTRGALQSAALGYWVREDLNGRGLATRAAREAVDHAFTTLELHRLQAETLLHNVPSQKVLRRAGFTPYGVAPDYLRIAGRWQDHLLFNVFSDPATP